MRRLPPAFLALACVAAAPPAPVRQPIKPWVLDYGETSCVAMRAYGSVEAPVTLAFRPSPNGRVVRIAVVRGGLTGDAHHFPVTLALGGAPLKTTGLRFAARNGKKDVVWINVERSALDALGSVREIGLQGGGELNERFALPQMAAVLKGLDTCTADLKRYWNFSDGPSTLAHPPEPTGNPQNWVTDNDYPAQAMNEEEAGRAGFVLLIDETGKVRDCTIEETTGIATLDAQACILMTDRARFRPARDSTGKPVRSTWSSRFSFRMP
jgi:TonB family protein